MEYHKLGNSGMVVSKLAIGAMYFGEETPEDDAFAIVDRFLEAGGTLVDTSDVYVGGAAEEIIGRWLADRPREVTGRVVLATKGRFPSGPDVNDQGLSRRHLHRALNASLLRLGVETVDLYQLHSSDMHTPVEETLSFLDDAVRAGKIQYIGLSNFSGWQLQLVASTAKAMGVAVPISLQPQYSLLSREIEWEIVPAARYNGIGLLPWSPLAGGLLTGKYQRGGKPAPNTRAGSENPLYPWTIAQYARLDRNWKTIDAVRRIATELGAEPAQVALSWLMDRPGVTAPICGARTLEHLEENLGAVNLKLDEAMTSELEERSRPVPQYAYPYGAQGMAMQERSLGKAVHPMSKVVSQGADNPLGGY